MDIQKSIASLSVRRVRTVAKSDLIYDSLSEAKDAESGASSAKTPKDFDKFKKEALTSADAGEKAVKPWETEVADWNSAINDLEKEIATEKARIAQQQKEDEAVSKAIDEINVNIKAYNDSLLLGERDPRARPLVLKKGTGLKLAAAMVALAGAEALAKDERDTLANQKSWVGKPIAELKTVKARVAKSKFVPPKK
jgi:chromosome segregation ATPase